MNKGSTFLVGWIFFCFLTGCVTRQAKRDLVVLLPDPDGKVGAVTVTTNGGSQTLDKPGYAIEVEDLNKAPIACQPLNESEIKGVFGPALSAQADSGRFISFILYFEHDSAKMTQESKNLLTEVLKAIKNRKSTEIYVMGHTDLVGTDAYNIQLSSKRASYVRDLLVSRGIKSSSFFVLYYGKARPLVLTNDEVPEPRNRRVEVIVR